MEKMLFIEECHINRSEGYSLGDSDVYETRFYADQKGELYRSLVQEYGRCTGKVYIDSDNPNNPKAVGWVFVQRRKYEDCNKTYLAETWVTVHKGPAKKQIIYQYAD